MNNILELKKITFKEGNSYRLNEINLRVKKGDKIALLGPSGAGKSTLISIANGTIIPSSGIVLWEGQPYNSLSKRNRCKIATLWQDLRLINELNIGQNINTGVIGKRNIIWALLNLIFTIEANYSLECLEAVGLNKNILNASINEISGGQRQRVAIARILRQEAELLLADEPLSNLDPSLIKELLPILLNQRPLKKISPPQTSIISLHRPELKDNFNRVIGLKNGSLVIDEHPKIINESILEWLYLEK